MSLILLVGHHLSAQFFDLIGKSCCLLELGELLHTRHEVASMFTSHDIGIYLL
jgi:hypothetical protein